MHICRLMTSDFMHGTGRFNADMGAGRELYDTGNLENGLGYAEDYLAAGVTKCPSEGFDLAGFAEWCREKLRCDMNNELQEKP